ncbi:aminotransferase class IV [Fusibacter bizertensis]
MLNQLTEYRIQDGTLITSTDDVSFSEPPVYEVIRLIDGVPLFFEEHMRRMDQSLKMIGESELLSSKKILEGIQTLVLKTNIRDNNVRIEVGRDQNHIFTWTLFLVISYYPNTTEYENGVKTIAYKVERANPHAKIFRTDFTAKINQLRKEQNVFEVILVNNEGNVTEGSRSNLFFIKDNKVYTAKTKDVLEGITRSKILEIIRELQIEIIEKDIKVDTLSAFEACFLTGTSINILPISAIDHIVYISPQHTLMIKILKALEEYVQNDLKQTRRLL